LARDPKAVRRLPNGQAWLDSVMKVPEQIRHLVVNRGHNWDISNDHDSLIDTSAAEQMTFTGTTHPPRQARGRQRNRRHLRHQRYRRRARVARLRPSR